MNHHLIDFDSLNEVLSDRIEDVLDILEISDYEINGNRVNLPCFLHDSNNPGSLCIFLNGHTTRGNWICWTQHCEKEHGHHLLNLVSKKLNHEDVFETADYLCNKLHINLDRINSSNLQFSKLFSVEEPKTFSELSREGIRSKLKYPCQYFIDRGFSKELLDKYDVGLCDEPEDFMYNRAVVPVYNENGMYVGCTGRSIFEKCEKCEKYHKGACPTTKLEKLKSVKWLNSKDFPGHNTLYNFNNAFEYIKETKTALLVEGQADVWTLESHFIHNSVGIFGDTLCPGQSSILDKAGTINLVLLLDSDKAGKKAVNSIKREYERYYNIQVYELESKDVTESSIEEINSIRNFLGEIY